jgi:2-polyprenyl-3-methyl-5-hydroxy-6-metoxy-1,4-benzoquinol methylase
MTMERCLVCGGPYGPSKLPGLLKCQSCSFVTADLKLSQSELEKLYDQTYFAGQEYKDYVGERALIEKHFRVRLRTLLQHVPIARTKRLFEIGAAYGFFLTVARGHFASVEGIDISRVAVNYAATVLGLPVHSGDFLEYPLEQKLDVVCMWDTIEHLSAPHLYIEKAAANMNPGGVIAITTGDLGSVVARLRGKRWRQIHPPTHLHYFSKATLSNLLLKHGFRPLYCGYEGMYRSLDTIAYIILNIKHKQPKVYSALKKTGMLHFDLYLNLYDILFIVAEKVA